MAEKSSWGGVRTGAGRKSSNQDHRAPTPLQAARARIAELEGEVARLKRELAGRVPSAVTLSRSGASGGAPTISSAVFGPKEQATLSRYQQTLASKPANIVEAAFAAAAAVAGGRECIHGATYGACRKLGCAPKRG
jgi:hypothetical protein